MIQIYTCTVESHKKESILGLCLNPSCLQTPQYCYKCLIEKHKKHIDDCKRFEDLKDLVQQLINENMRPVKVFFEIMKTITDQCQKTTIKIQKKLHGILQLQEMLVNQQFSDLKENLDYLRTICSKEFQDQKNFITYLCQELENFKNECEEQKFVLININDGQEKIYYKKGCQLLKQYQFEKAIIQFDLTLQKNPNHFDALSQKGKCLRYLKRYEEANKCLDHGLQINQNHYLLNLEKGNVLTTMNVQDQAIVYIFYILLYHK